MSPQPVTVVPCHDEPGTNSPRHVPDEIRQISEVPRTLSGKVLEVPVKRILMGTPADQAASRESLANPDALDYFVELGGENRSARDS